MQLIETQKTVRSIKPGMFVKPARHSTTWKEVGNVVDGQIIFTDFTILICDEYHLRRGEDDFNWQWIDVLVKEN